MSQGTSRAMAVSADAFKRCRQAGAEGVGRSVGAPHLSKVQLCFHPSFLFLEAQCVVQGAAPDGRCLGAFHMMHRSS